MLDAQLRGLWALCFPNSVCHIENPLIYAENGTVFSMLNRRTITVCGLKAVYIFGVATHPGARGRGFASRLVKDALRESGGFDLAALIPAEAKTVPFYQRLGFTLRGRMPVVSQDIPSRKTDDIAALSSLYDKAFPCRAERTEKDWEEILTEYHAGLTHNGYAVWDESGVLERVPFDPDAPDTGTAACIIPLRTPQLPERPYINLLLN